MNRHKIEEEIKRNIKAMEDQDHSKDALPYMAARNLSEDLKDAILKFKQDLKPMKKVIRLDEPKEESKKPIELRYCFTDSTKVDNSVIEKDEKITYLGRCSGEGDFFMGKTDDGQIHIYKGHLNDGVY